MRLPSGGEVLLPLEFLGAGTWGSHIPPSLAGYLVHHRATGKDALILQIKDGEAGVCDGRIDHVGERDELAVVQRDRELADVAHEFLRRNKSIVVPIWEIIVGLLARGAYRAVVPPHPVQDVLTRDKRFVDSGLRGWMLAAKSDSTMQLNVRARQRLEADLAGHDLLVEKVLWPEAGTMYPRCVTGMRASPPEDVGGMWGYAEFLEIMADPAHPEHEERLEWAGGEFDAEEFNLAGVNEALQLLSAAWG